MNKTDFKNLKVGDKVKIVKGSESYHFYVKDMSKAIGKFGKVFSIDRADGDVKIEFNEKVYYNSNFLRFSPSWLEKVEDIPEPEPVEEETNPHPQAEVLRWIADGKVVEFNNTHGGNEWKILDVKHNFSIFEDMKYRICTNPEKYKKYQILCKWPSDGAFYIADTLYSKEEAGKIKNFVKVLE